MVSEGRRGSHKDDWQIFLYNEGFVPTQGVTQHKASEAYAPGFPIFEDGSLCSNDINTQHVNKTDACSDLEHLQRFSIRRLHKLRSGSSNLPLIHNSALNVTPMTDFSIDSSAND